jgi:hypothetical protein
MTLEEERLSELLKRTVPEQPPLELSADRVTVLHVDRSRRSWLIPVLAAASVVVIAGAGAGLSSLTGSAAKSASGASGSRSVHAASTTSATSSASTSATATAAVITPAPAMAPKAFNPLELPANFGWLPAGFTENGSVGSFAMSQGPLEVMTTQESLGAAASDGEGFQLTVAANGVKPSPWIGGGTGSDSELSAVGTAPDINGHPAKWLAGGIEWEYATGGWAILLTGGNTAAQAATGWGQSCKSVGGTQEGNGVVANPGTSCAAIPPQTSALQDELVKVASNLTWQATPFTFAYKFTQALPAGWTPGSDTGAFVNGVLTSSQLDLYSSVLNVKHTMGDPDETLDITGGADPSGETFCQNSGGSLTTYNGVKYEVLTGQKGIGADYIPTWSSSATPCPDPMGKHGQSGIGITADSAADNEVGVAGLDAILPIIQWIPNQADWTTSPLAK